MATAEPPLVERARAHGDRVAIVAAEGTSTYRDLLAASRRVAVSLLGGADDLEEARIGYLVPPGLAHVAVQWGIWRAGGVAVPLAASHPPPELDYVIADAGMAAVIAHPDCEPVIPQLAAARRIPYRVLDRGFPAGAAVGDAAVGPAAPVAPFGGDRGEAARRSERSLPSIPLERRALIVYTSGTTGRPKGAVTTHRTLRAQVTSLITAWEWTCEDRILSVLPLHHVHGIVNVLSCALWAGATCEILPRFDADTVWSRISVGEITLFMAVPTIYRRLVDAWDEAPEDRRRAMTAGCARVRLMVSGSAALPLSTLQRWEQISGHLLLERYGMTEIGMALANPLHGERLPGRVGTPLPGVQVRLVDKAGRVVAAGSKGEIEVRGPTVFLEYWRRPEETEASFHDGWFRTGDTAVVENGSYRILGRTSIDIIKSGGFKVSALEVEDALRAHPQVGDCAVVGVEDPEWGERVCAAVELRGDEVLTLTALRDWARERLAPYKIPKSLRCVDSLPRNAMGKVQKPRLAEMFAQRPSGRD